MKPSRLYLFFIFALIFFCTVTNPAFSQSFDYEDRPVFDFQFIEAQIDLEVNPEDGSVAGSVVYELKANISGADTLTLDAPGIETESVMAGGEETSFEAGNDTLFIPVAESTEMGQTYTVEINYRATPRFGLLKSSEGTIWTSMLPRSVRHWLPVKDHPRVQMTTSLTLQTPPEFTAFGSGVKTEDRLQADGSSRVTFRSGRPVPITALAFGFGRMDVEGSSVGIKRINSYAESNTISAEAQSDLVNTAVQMLGAIEKTTGLDYPYQRLHMVVLNDHYWEEKPYGASTIFLYKNRGDMKNQLRRGLYGQWFGVFRHEVQWDASKPVSFMQSILHRQLSDVPAALEANTDEPETTFSTPYSSFSVENWNFWQEYDFGTNSNTKQIARKLMPAALQEGAEPLTPANFRDAWYLLSGQPSVDLPGFDQGSNAGISSAAGDSVRYRVDYTQAAGSNTLGLKFTAEERSIQQPLSIPIEIISGGSSNTSQISFSGSTDSVSVPLPAGTRNVMLKVPEGRKLAFEEHKPVPYVLYQLRNTKSAEAKKQAAQMLGNHTDNPDLQLALNDLMKQDMEPAVEAALLQSYGKITAGAEGTQDRFLQALESENRDIRAAALQILSNYKDKEVTQRLRTFSENEQDTKLSNKALNLYLQRTGPAAALEYTNTLVQQDTAGSRAILAIAALAEKGSTDQAVKLADFYTDAVFAYPVRRRAFNVLLSHDTSADRWSERLDLFLNDHDPRIRFITVKNMDEIPGADVESIISSQREREYDARVFEVLR